MNRPKLWTGIVTAGALLIGLSNYFLIQRQLSGVIRADPRNEGISAAAHYKFFILPTSIVFDLRHVPPGSRPADISRILLQFAGALKNRNFSSVILSYKGHPKFLLKGEYFHTLGVEYGIQNPVYTLRTLPENVYKLDGSPAFGSLSGGWLGVMRGQMEDLNSFHRQWYIADIAGQN